MRVLTADAPSDTDTLIVAAGAGAAKRGRLSSVRDGDRTVIEVGLGDVATLDRRAWHEIAAAAHGRARELEAGAACWQLGDSATDLATSAITEAAVLGSYRRGRFKTGDDTPSGPEAVTIAGGSAAVIERATTIAAAMNRARELQDAPPNVLTPHALGDHASAIAIRCEHVSFEVGARDRLEKLGMGAFLGVAQGSDVEPALIVLRYEPPGATGPLLGLVGKGVTFDSGGLSIKPANSMVTMKSDMSGAAAVIEATAAIAALKLPVRVLAVVGATENSINGHAMRPGDVLTAANGTTIEIDNTDAEGRLVLADCLHHAMQQGADELIDVATLTGAMKVALGSEYCGYFATSDDVAGAVEAAASAAGEDVWRMPLDPRYGEHMKGTVADLTNAALGKGGGACSAAAFLQRFTGERPWAHFDFSTAYDAGAPWAKKGGSGGLVRTLVEYAAARSAS